MGEGESAGLARVAKSLDEVHAIVPADGVVTCLEITAGQGTSLGYQLEHLAEIIAQVNAQKGWAFVSIPLICSQPATISAGANTQNFASGSNRLSGSSESRCCI